jgi:hypothetical protein
MHTVGLEVTYGAAHEVRFGKGANATSAPDGESATADEICAMLEENWSPALAHLRQEV